MKVDDSMLHHVLQVAEPVVEVLQVNARPPPGTLPEQIPVHHNAKNRAEWKVDCFCKEPSKHVIGNAYFYFYKKT